MVEKGPHLRDGSEKMSRLSTSPKERSAHLYTVPMCSEDHMVIHISPTRILWSWRSLTAQHSNPRCSTDFSNAPFQHTVDLHGIPDYCTRSDYPATTLYVALSSTVVSVLGHYVCHRFVRGDFFMVRRKPQVRLLVEWDCQPCVDVSCYSTLLIPSIWTALPSWFPDLQGGLPLPFHSPPDAGSYIRFLSFHPLANLQLFVLQWLTNIFQSIFHFLTIVAYLGHASREQWLGQFSFRF